MKITGVRTRIYEFELDRPIADANRPQGLRRLAQLAVELECDQEVVGVAIGAPGSEALVQRLVKELLVGRDPRGARGLWQLMADAVFKGANQGAVSTAISTLDIALWDLKAKCNGEPLWKTLGAAGRKVRLYASDLGLALSDPKLEGYYRRMASKGIAAGKLKVGPDPEADLRRLGVMQRGLRTHSTAPELMVDANEYWSAKQTIRYLCQFEEQFDLTWVEEPARRWDVAGLRQVSRAVRAAVATGENLREVREFTPLVAGGAVDVVQVGVNNCGITGALRVADLAYAFDLPVSVMNSPASYLGHLAAALPNHMMMEVLDVGRGQGLHVDSRVEDGWLILGDSPGLGVTFDHAALDALAVAAPSQEARRMGWGRREGAGLYLAPPGSPPAPPE